VAAGDSGAVALVALAEAEAGLGVDDDN
jgi:hypothetical protein